MTIAAAGHSKTRRKNWAQRFVVFFVVLAFALQAFITQTHIHGGSLDSVGVAKITAAKTPSQVKTPLDSGRADCPLCQAIVHSGVFVASATPLLQLPFAWVQTVAFVSSARADSRIAAHDWHSRAPPRG